MHTEVILTKNVQGLGAEGDKIAVAPGYARNFLLPRGFAKLATEASVKHIEALKKKRDEREAAEKVAAEQVAQSISRLACSITVKMGAQGKMFGSVTSGDIHDFLAKQGITVDRKQVALERPIQQIGEHHVAINLVHGVAAQLKVQVVAAEPPPTAAPTERGPRRPERRDRPERPERGARRPVEKRADAPAAGKPGQKPK